MGHCASKPTDDSFRSTSEQKLISEKIDKQLQEDSKKFKKECKILLLGSSESGKSTIVKQMKIIHQNGYTPSELLSFRPVIYRNLLESAQALVKALRELSLEPEGDGNKERGALIESTELPEGKLAEGGERAEVGEDVARAIHEYVMDPVVVKVMNEHSSEFYLMDSAQYFFSSALRIGHPQYQPTVSDVLRARLQTTSITETRFSMGEISVHMFDVGGQRSERRKWIHCFESVTSIIFCASLSEYDQVLLEEDGQNRMSESLTLFGSIVNSRWFLRSSMILFLNKTDVFKSKLPRIPLEKYFPEYIGGSDINKAIRYILWRFMQTKKAKLAVYPHLTQATDTANIKLVFAALQETILQNSLKDSKML